LITSQSLDRAGSVGTWNDSIIKFTRRSTVRSRINTPRTESRPHSVLMMMMMIICMQDLYLMKNGCIEWLMGYLIIYLYVFVYLSSMNASGM